VDTFSWLRLRVGLHRLARPSTPITLPTQIIWSAGGDSRASLPVSSARYSGASLLRLGLADRHAHQRALGARR
jgi:hypothetical protein